MKILLTHNGTFHADDVFAVATFLLAHPGEDWRIVRSRDKEAIKKADAVIDTGHEYNPEHLRFDHHQEGGAGVHENGIPYAAFGLVWKEYGALVCGGDYFVAKQIEDSLVSALDANDNGVKICEEIYPISPFDLSQYVRIWNHTWKEEQEAIGNLEDNDLKAFTHLVEWAKGLILREVTRYKDKNAAFELVQAAYSSAKDKRLIILDYYYPWQSALMEYPEPLFVVYPTTDGKWAAKTVPVGENSFESRKQFPETWSGKEGEELQRVSEVPQAIFCHRGRFLVIADSKEGAITLAKIALKA